MLILSYSRGSKGKQRDLWRSLLWHAEYFEGREGGQRREEWCNDDVTLCLIWWLSTNPRIRWVFFVLTQFLLLCIFVRHHQPCKGWAKGRKNPLVSTNPPWCPGVTNIPDSFLTGGFTYSCRRKGTTRRLTLCDACNHSHHGSVPQCTLCVQKLMESGLESILMEGKMIRLWSLYLLHKGSGFCQWSHNVEGAWWCLTA